MSGKKSKSNKRTTAKKRKKLPIIISAAAAVAVIAAIAAITLNSCFKHSAESELRGGVWVPYTADNASGDEVDIRQVYNVNYDNYQGSLSFYDDGRFELWLSPGNPDDGTHGGTYQLNEDGNIDAVFDEGTQTEFVLNRSNGAIQSIIIYYSEYEVYFSRQQGDIIESRG